jgi:hypothetical protein
MNRRFFVVLAAILASLLGASRPCCAGRILFETSVKNVSRDVADGFTATLEPNGLFYKWAGYSATLKGGKIVADNDEPDLFSKSPDEPVRSFTVKSFDKQNTVASQGYMIFSSVRNNVSLDKTKTMYLSATQAVPTAFGKAVKSKVGDPVVDISNSTGSAIQLLSATAQINNSRDLYDLSRIFVPDGKAVPTMPSFTPNQRIRPGGTLEFSFSDVGAKNWSFEVTYQSGGDLYQELIAQSVPEPTSIALLAIGACGVGVLAVRQRP